MTDENRPMLEIGNNLRCIKICRTVDLPEFR
jgi:hypothetical protein